MSRSVAILGAGGKMGLRVAQKIHTSNYDLRAVEIGTEGIARLQNAGIQAVPQDAAIENADVVVLALPDSVIGAVAREIVPQLKPGTIILILDAAAPYAGVLPDRDDVTYFVGHPCHPPLYADLDDPEQRRDVHGGVAPQAIVCALMQGPEEHYDIGREVCEAMWSPIIRTHRVTMEQLAILEPGLSEMVAMPFVDVMIEAVELCASKYDIPRQAAFDFMIGHLNVEISMWFGFTPKVPSDAALRLMRFARGVVVRDGWETALDPKTVKDAAELIVRG